MSDITSIRSSYLITSGTQPVQRKTTSAKVCHKL